MTIMTKSPEILREKKKREKGASHQSRSGRVMLHIGFIRLSGSGRQGEIKGD
jgi:hypothetical protein